MAQRKPFVPRPPRRRKPRKSKDIDAFAYAEFMRSLLVGNVRATKLIDTRDQLGRLMLAYDDPNG